ncbi:rubredoxin [Pseudomonas sp. NPDC087697]|uniref:rubredoxin n=1 Tax=Pseudomonas sp. NPDC087697 TaxID=3364447 RepID=UPI0037F23E44
MPTEEKVMNCTVCGYEYDPTAGDPENGIPPGTYWKDIPDSWLCPDCHMPKEDFE